MATEKGLADVCAPTEAAPTETTLGIHGEREEVLYTLHEIYTSGVITRQNSMERMVPENNFHAPTVDAGDAQPHSR